MIEQRCYTCKWWGGLLGSSICNYPLPFWVRREIKDPMADYVTGDHGEDCSTYEDRA